MLGVQRTSVTISAHALQDAGLIKYARGRITIVDRGGVEECDLRMLCRAPQRDRQSDPTGR
jgi:Mn-dependent DtxR family transcriptional regulator